MRPALELLRDFFVQRALLYLLTAATAMVVLGPMGDLRLRFRDDHCSRCILYSSVDYSNTTGDGFTHIEFGQAEACEFVLAVSAVFGLLLPLMLAMLNVVLYRRDAQETRDENKVDLGTTWFVCHVTAEAAAWLLLTVAAGLVSHGFSTLCDSLTTQPHGPQSCQDAQTLGSWGHYDGSNFFTALTAATAGSWLLWLCWSLQLSLGLWKLWRLNLTPCLPCTAGGD